MLKYIGTFFQKKKIKCLLVLKNKMKCKKNINVYVYKI